MKMRNLLRNKKGQGLVEYALIVGGVALIAGAAVSILGHKTTDLIGATATIIPGAHADDNGPLQSGKLIETATNADGSIVIDAAGIALAGQSGRLDTNVLGADGTTDGFGGLITESGE